MNTRRIFKSRTSRQSEVLDVLSSLLVAEIAQPSAELLDCLAVDHRPRPAG